MSVETWTSPAFGGQARAWVAERLAPLGVGADGGRRAAARPAVVQRDPLRDHPGRVWFKVNGTGTRHEATLVRELDRLVPGLVPEVLAVDAARGWSLTRDAGRVLREAVPADALWGAWERLLPRYAEAQVALSGHRDELLATGITEVSPATVPGLARQLLDELAATPEDEGGLTPEQAAAAGAGAARCWTTGARSSPARGVPDSVQHDDLHSANVCWPGTAADARVIDWGDATWGHPLGTMLATLNSIAFHAGTYVDGRPATDPGAAAGAGRLPRAVHRFAAHADLVRGVDLARRTGCVGKALAYRAALPGAAVDARRDRSSRCATGSWGCWRTDGPTTPCGGYLTTQTFFLVSLSFWAAVMVTSVITWTDWPEHPVEPEVDGLGLHLGGLARLARLAGLPVLAVDPSAPSCPAGPAGPGAPVRPVSPCAPCSDPWNVATAPNAPTKPNTSARTQVSTIFPMRPR